MSPDAIARACAEAMWAEDHASRGLGMRLERVEPGSATLSMTVTAAMARSAGKPSGRARIGRTDFKA